MSVWCGEFHLFRELCECGVTNRVVLLGDCGLERATLCNEVVRGIILCMTCSKHYIKERQTCTLSRAQTKLRTAAKKKIKDTRDGTTRKVNEAGKRYLSVLPHLELSRVCFNPTLPCFDVFESAEWSVQSSLPSIYFFSVRESQIIGEGEGGATTALFLF